jgi:hypothetical protein
VERRYTKAKGSPKNIKAGNFNNSLKKQVVGSFGFGKSFTGWKMA